MAVILLLSLIISFMPFEKHLFWIIELIKYPVDNLSGLAKKLPLALGVLFDILFYPILTAVPFLLMHFSIKKGTNRK